MAFGGLKKRRRMQVIGIAMVALAGATALIGDGMRDGINFFRSPSQVVADPPNPSEVFRIGGLVEEGNLIRREGSAVTFRVTDGGGNLPVSYVGSLPDLFAEAQGMVGTGRYIDGTFVATEILARHDETYMPERSLKRLKSKVSTGQPEARGFWVTTSQKRPLPQAMALRQLCPVRGRPDFARAANVCFDGPQYSNDIHT